MPLAARTRPSRSRACRMPCSGARASAPSRSSPAAGVFGANASGKSNLLRAMSVMRRHVLYSFSHGDPERGMPRSAFRLDAAREKQSVAFRGRPVLPAVRHEYGFVIDDAQVLEEWAYRYPHGKAALLFRREGARRHARAAQPR